MLFTGAGDRHRRQPEGVASSPPSTASTGKVVWKIDRKRTGRHGSYATPVVATLAGKPQLILTGHGRDDELRPGDRQGALVVRRPGRGDRLHARPVGDKLVFATGGFPEKELLAIRADGHGDVSKSHVAWRTGKGVDLRAVAAVPRRPAVRGQRRRHGHLLRGRDRQAGLASGSPGGFTSSPVLVGDASTSPTRPARRSC